MLFCSNCGTKMESGSGFCSECGAAVVASSLRQGAAAEVRMPTIASSNLSGSDAGLTPAINEPSKNKNVIVAEKKADEANILESFKRILLNPMSFVMIYCSFMIPTYILPYVGSNSSVINSLGAATGVGLNPALYFHIAALAILIFTSWLRGNMIDKSWLGVLPFAASLFDLLPGLSIIPFVPTILHVVTIIMGVKQDSKK